MAGRAMMLAPLIGAWIGFGLFIIIAGALVAWFSDRLAHRRRNLVLADYFEHVLQLPLAYHAGAHSGRQMKIMLTGTDTLWWLWVSFFREHFAAFVFIVRSAAGDADPELAAGAAAVRAVRCLYGADHAGHAQGRCHAARGRASIIPISPKPPPMRSAMSRWCRATPASSSKCPRCKGLVNSLLRAQMPVLSWWAVAAVLTRAATTLTLLVILLAGTYLKLVGLASVGQIVSFMSIAALLIARLEQVVGFANRLFMDAPKLAEFFGVLDTVPAVRDRPDAVDPGRVRGLVEFKDVSFSYDGKRSAVADLSFTALPGDRVALVGPTGSGKSTALALLHRAFDPQSGVIAVDGMDIRALTLTGLRRNIGVVFQETLLFNRSIAENLRVGKPDATAMRCAKRRPGRRRSNSSTAIPKAWRRASASAAGCCPAASASALAIARALLKNPPILILDEATSALDPVTEARVQLALDEVMKGRTTFVIAHRLATVRNATRILVFRDGRIVETGTFDELVQRGGFFAELVRAQFMPAAEGAPQLVAAAEGSIVET